MKNTLSKKHSVYPNGNKHFTYILSKKELNRAYLHIDRRVKSNSDLVEFPSAGARFPINPKENIRYPIFVFIHVI